MSSHLQSTLEAQYDFISRLETCFDEIKEMQELAQTCSAACELDSVEQMIKERDKTIRDLGKKRAAKAGSHAGQRPSQRSASKWAPLNGQDRFVECP